ncbi:TlpA family protein disulfide reductase [bacterium]|jgi:peroxiredoxin|nr:TlpA family protein disulfide reductase [bacterium]MBT4250170.1 TlpA family protein disulfide reductase [bacterium]MBT4927331.1 TlpA family protein disulfide reductase [bacterium]MBT6018033.1 TlpA family protein disulfide reductase [bacterium]
MIYLKFFLVLSLTLFLGCSGKQEKKKINEIEQSLNVSNQKMTLEKVNNNSKVALRKNKVIKTEKAKSLTSKESQKMKAPDFLLADLDGNVMSFSAYEGQVVLLTFWGTWCGPCRQEIPDFIKLYDEFNNEGLEIVGIAIQSGGTESIKKFSDYYKINYPVLTDIEGNESYKAFSDFGTISGVGTRAVPTTFLIDRAGYIVKTYRGARPGHVFSKDFKPYL